MGLKYHLALAAVAALALAGCGGAATPAQNSGPSGLPAACLDEKTISAVLGFPAHVEPATVKQSADAVTCTFLADDQTSRPGVNISILVAPESFAAKALQDLTDSAARAGTTTTAVAVGRQGIAYESADRSAAATVVGGKLVGVTLDGMGLSSPGTVRGIVVDLLGKVAAKLGATQAQAAALPPVTKRPDSPAPQSPKPQSRTPQGKVPASASTAVSPKPSGKPSGQLLFDPFDAITCTWVPRMFVDLSGGSKPGIDLRLPLLASQVDTKVTVAIRSELNGSLSHATTTVTVGPNWRGSAHLALAAPAYGNFVSIASELDTDGRLAGRTVRDSRRTVEGMIPDPRPGSEQSFGCNPVP